MFTISYLMYIDKAGGTGPVSLASDPPDSIPPRDAFQHLRPEHDAPQGGVRILESRTGAERDKKPISARVRSIQYQADRTPPEEV